MKRFMTLLKIEGKLGFRCPDPIFFGIIMPVGIFFLIAWIAGDKQVQTGNYTFLINFDDRHMRYSVYGTSNCTIRLSR